MIDAAVPGGVVSIPEIEELVLGTILWHQQHNRVLALPGNDCQKIEGVKVYRAMETPVDKFKIIACPSASSGAVRFQTASCRIRWHHRKYRRTRC